MKRRKLSRSEKDRARKMAGTKPRKSKWDGKVHNRHRGEASPFRAIVDGKKNPRYLSANLVEHGEQKLLHEIRRELE